MTDTRNGAAWAIVRQVVIGAESIDATSKELRDAFGLAEGFADPLLEEMGLADETIRVGSEAHLEVVAAIRDDASIAGWIAKGGGGGGYALSIQVPDIAPLLAAAEADGVRAVADVEAYGHRIVQLHPGDMGLLVELDEIADPAAWFWDDITTEEPAAPVIDDILAVDLSSSDPVAQARRWATVFGVEVGSVEGVPQIVLGTRTLRFVEGPRRFLSAVEVAVVPGREVERTELEISGVRFTLTAR